MAVCKTNKGFTLLELLVVVAILAAVASIASGSFWHVNEDVNKQLVYAEMRQIAAAIKQFKQDTGYYPKQGPFALGGSGGMPYTQLDGWMGSSGGTASDDEKRRWFESPANFYQLLTATCPLADTNDLCDWDKETGRGWRGPYLTGFSDGYVDISDSINGTAYSAWHDKDPAKIGSGDKGVPDVIGLADPFEARSIKTSASEVGGTVLDWSRLRRKPSGDSSGYAGRKHEHEREYWGRPYLYFLNVEVVSDTVGNNKTFLVCMGPDGDYDAANYNDDLTTNSDDTILVIE